MARIEASNPIGQSLAETEIVPKPVEPLFENPNNIKANADSPRQSVSQIRRVFVNILHAATNHNFAALKNIY